VSQWHSVLINYKLWWHDLHNYSMNYRSVMALNSLGLWPLVHLLHQPQIIRMGLWWKSDWQGRTEVFG